MAKKKKKKKKDKKKPGRKGNDSKKRRDRKGPKAASKKAAQRRKPAAAAGPKPIQTGKAPAPLEVARRVAELLRAGKAQEVEKDWLAPGIESVEGVGVSLAWNGKKAVLDKYRSWEADHEIHDMKLEGPWVGATGFALKYRIDVTQKSTGQRSQMEEIAVYTVRNGKITREEFHFATGA